MQSCNFAWLPPYNDMQNVPKRRQSSCSHYRSVCHQCKLTLQGCTSEPIHTRQANKEEQRKTPPKYLQSDSRKTLAVIYVCYLAILRAVCSQYCDVSQWCKLTLQGCTHELIHNAASEQRRATKTPPKYLQSDSRKTLADISCVT